MKIKKKCQIAISWKLINKLQKYMGKKSEPEDLDLILYTHNRQDSNMEKYKYLLISDNV